MKQFVRCFFALSCFSIICIQASWAQPANDQCSGAIAFNVGGGAISVSNAGTVVNGPEPSCGGVGIKDIWYSFVYSGGTLTISTTLGSNTDTRIAVYNSCGGTMLACDDDSGPGNASLLSLTCTTLTIGNTYFIQAGGFNAITGGFSINVTQNLGGCTNPAASNYNPCAITDNGTCLLPPVNDVCGSAIALSIDATPLSTNNSLAVNEGSNPSCGNNGSQMIKDIWFSFVANNNALEVKTTTGTLSDTRIAVYNACGGSEIACNDDITGGLASQINFDCGDLVAGNTYYIRAGGYGSLSGAFTIQVATTNSCVVGESCDVPFSAVEGINTAPFPNSWYTITPDSSGQWKISTCGLATCDTKIWIYDYCNMANFDDSNVAALTYADDVCGVQAEIAPLLAAGETYYFRIGDTDDDCGTGTIDFLVEYQGPTAGCMDINACNYTPIAEIPGPCYYNGDPNCNNLGPDLEIQGNLVYSSLFVSSITSNDACYINEGCLQGFGSRQLLKFTTQIKNIGNQDYFIGVPTANNPQFEWDECHNHYHYEGYAEYLLFDQDGTPMPQIGFKNGFCVLDLGCPSNISAKYTCGNMGITAGCWDTYSSSLACQWIDITDVPAGDYYLVVRTNWDQSPDALGHYELRYDNNWSQVCIHFERDVNNNIINFTKNISTCPVIEDCIGIPFGNNYPDCANNCPGMVKRGDITGEGALSEEDVHEYMESTIEGGIGVSTCTDLNGDGSISVADASYLHACIHGQEELGVLPEDMTDCPYDPEIVNPLETTTISVYAVEGNDGYADIALLNPDNYIGAIEFEVTGLEITDVESLIDPLLLEAHIHFSPEGHISLLTENETYYNKYSIATPVLRIHFSDITDDEVCISTIIDVMDEHNHNTLTIIGDCQPILIDFANFSAVPTQLCEGGGTEFTDLSTRNPINWIWTFEGGNPANSDLPNPIVTYDAPGVYQVTLQVNDGIIADSEIKTAYIVVDAEQNWFADEDEDGFGDPSSVQASCIQPLGTVSDNNDCDDTRNDVYPGAPGTAQNIDNNCNGNIEGDELNACVGDFNGDGAINVNDLLMFNAAFGCTSSCGPMDITGDGVVNTADVLLFLAVFGTNCP